MDIEAGVKKMPVCSKCGYQIKDIGSLQAKIVNGKLEHIECPVGKKVVTEPKPTEGRLLTCKQRAECSHNLVQELREVAMCEAQRDLTTSELGKESEVNRALILSLTKQCEELDIECVARLKGIKEEIEKAHPEIINDDTSWNWWQALWEGVGV